MLAPTRLTPVQDTVTGFLLAGVGNVDYKRNSNFLVVDSSTGESRASCSRPSFSHDDAETRQADIEAAFKAFSKRDDIAIILINQHVRWPWSLYCAIFDM